MPQDAFTLKYVAEELNNYLSGGKISRINQPEKEVLHFLIYTRTGTVKLTCDLSAKYCRLSLGEELGEANPETAPNFLMLLRKHLQNAEIERVSCGGSERVVCFYLTAFSEFETTPMRLYFEIMGKYSNAILTRDETIVGALKTAGPDTGARRITLSGAKYIPPYRQEKVPQDDIKAIEEVMANRDGETAKLIAERVAGVAYTTAEDIVYRYGENASGEKIYEYLNCGEYYPCVVYENGKPTDFKARECPNGKRRKDLLTAQAEYYEYAVSKKKFSDKKRKLSSSLSSAVKKAEKRLAQIGDKLCECDKAEDVKLCGELITANIYAIERGMTKFSAVNYYDENGGKIDIELDGRLSPSQNAQRYYKKYAKLKRTLQNLSGQKSEEEEKLNYLKTIECNITAAEDVYDLDETETELISLGLLPPPPKLKKGKRKEAAPKRRFRKYSCGGFIVLCGRNNVQNDELTKSLSPDDLWLHAKTYHSAHVSVLCESRKPTDEAIKFAAEVCAYYSDASKNGKVPVDYAYKKFVKKPKGANAGYFEYTEHSTILVTPDGHTEARQDD